MPYQIDQSGKIEQTNRHTVVTLANGHTKTVRISAAEKQRLIKAMIILDYPIRNYAYKIFAALSFLLIRQFPLSFVQIDTEYTGHSANIKQIIEQLMEIDFKKCPEIEFGFIGKKTNAHLMGIAVYRGERLVDMTVQAKDILKILYRKRLEPSV